MIAFDPAGVALHVIARLAVAGPQGVTIDDLDVIVAINLRRGWRTRRGAAAPAARRSWRGFTGRPTSTTTNSARVLRWGAARNRRPFSLRWILT